MFGDIAPGVAGIYLSAVFGASLSTISSSINSCSVVVIEDLLRPYTSLSSKTLRYLPKILMIGFGAIILSFAYLSKNFEGLF